MVPTALMPIVIDSFTTVPDLRLGEQSSTRQTFQVLRLPWMAEVLEPPGAAPVKTWKV
jgi:hypothetical protein